MARRKKTIRGAELLCRSLVEEGVTYLFGYTGGAIMPVYDAFPKFPQLTHVMVRHEQAAAFAAQGMARATGKAGVCIATSGPGATNLMTGIADAHMDSIPLVAITGQVATSVIGTDAFQESDIIGMLVPVTKQSYILDDPYEIPRVVKEAFYLANTGRKGPVNIDFPKDIANAIVEDNGFDTTIRYPVPPPPGIGKDQATRAQDLMDQSERPIVFVGHGVIQSGAQREVRHFLERSHMPFACTLHGISALPADHPQSLGMMGMHGTVEANRAIEKADLIIALGMRFDDRVTGKLDEYAKDADVIHVEHDPSEINKNVRATVAMYSDLKPAVVEMTKVVKPKPYKEWYTYAAKNRKYWNSIDPINSRNGRGNSGNLLMGAVIRKLSDLTGGKDNVVADVGQHQMFAARYYRFHRFNTWFNSGGLGSMGFSVPAAMGVKFARPEERVWVIVGDGSFQMNIQELGTIMEQKIDIKILLLNNNFLGMVRQWQDLFHGSRFVGTPVKNPDFIALAAAYGIAGERVSEGKDLEPALRRAMKHKGAYLLEIVTDMEEMILPMIPAGSRFSDMRVTR
ncbi:MAG TPA: biosynthetic-type acetolactate synthase large subunit [Candidatus Deferrimicrobiaceae bacterium]|nr:biosynthetic-type acetolactate synthase large subunit [Candidatus Deferrimicrobiaceae bacterium]